MKGKGIYLAIAALIGILSALDSDRLMVLLMLLYLYFLYRFKSMTKLRLFLFVLVFIIYSGVGFLASIHNKTELTGSEHSLQVQLLQTDFNGDVLLINGIEQTTHEKLLIRYRIHSPQEKALLKSELRYGFICSLSGTIEPPSPSKNPNVFNYQQYLSTKQIYWIFNVNSISPGNCQATSPTFFSLMDQIRTAGINYVSKYFPEPTASLAIALLFGDQSYMNSELVTAYQKIGIVHLLAISGLQVTLLTGVLFYIGLRIGMVREKMITMLMVFLPLYAILTGATPSVVRAVMMMFVILISLKWGGRRLNSLDALCYAFLIIVLCSPYLIYDIGFQLSFCACVALLLSTPYIFTNEAGISQLILTSYIAQLATLPIILVHFFEVSLLSIAANLLFVPFFSVFLTPFFFLVFVLHPFLAFIINPLLWATNKLIMIVNDGINMISALPFHMMILGKPGKFLLLLLSVSILVIFYKLEKDYFSRLQNSLLIVVPLVVIAVIQNWSPYGEVTFIDVGQGDAILVKLPFNKGTYLIDTGGNPPFSGDTWQQKRTNFEVGKDIIVPYLKSKGISTLDKLILTHGDIDHVGGTSAVIEELSITEILLPKVKAQSDIELEIVRKANQKGIPIHYVYEGKQWGDDESLFKVLAPAGSGVELDKNNQSIVLYAKIGGLTWLFTGDIEETGEMELAENYSFIDVDVLKVGHHGSKTSSSEELLQQFQPEIAVISVGEGNRYGHPHGSVLTRLASHQMTIYRTDKNGAISYFFKNGPGTFSVMLP